MLQAASELARREKLLVAQLRKASSHANDANDNSPASLSPSQTGPNRLKRLSNKGFRQLMISDEIRIRPLMRNTTSTASGPAKTY
jgi:hypothetical protein